MKTIKVLIVDDSLLFRQMLIKYFLTVPHIQIIGYAVNASDARQKIISLKPDVVTLDVEMPGMSGIDFLKDFLPEHPVPVILVSSLNIRVFDALSYGAVDFIRKPEQSVSYSISKDAFFSSLQSKIVIASQAHVKVPSKPGSQPALPVPPITLSHNALSSTIIGIGASTGGTETTLEILKMLPKEMPGIVITQHMPEGFTAMYAERLNRICKLEVKEAKNGDPVLPGRVLIAPGSLQMRVVSARGGYQVRCTRGEKVNGHCPSVDVLFSSIAENVSIRKIGIILTGMGRDGADGLLQMRKKGAFTIGQDKNSSVVYGMPMVANNIGAVCVQSSYRNIASVLLNHLKQ